MPNGIYGRVENRMIVAEVPQDWPDGTRVTIFLECRPNLTVHDDPRTVEVMVVINNLHEAVKREEPTHESNQ